MNTTRIQIFTTALRLAAILALAAPAAFAQNSFSESIHRKQPTAGQDSMPVNGPQTQNTLPPQATNPRVPTAPNQGATDPRFATVAIAEAKDFGVPPTDMLHDGPMHGPTPTRIPGGLVITTEALDSLYKTQQGKFIVFDVLGGPQCLPGAQNALGAAQAGTFTDQNQQQFGQYLQQMTGGNKQTPLVFYCQSVECWMSYNAALRAIKLGYTQVLWYRGGIEAWQAAGLQTFGAGGR